MAVSRLRVVLFGSGSPMSVAALHSLRQVSEIVRVVVPRRRPSARALLRRLLRRERENPLAVAARDEGIPVSTFDQVERDPEPVSCDLICVATFPHLLSDDIVSRGRMGALNVHPSILPRHRGPDPLFWTYFHGDKETGVTVHWLAKEADAGDIVGQRRWELARGTRVTDLYLQQIQVGCTLLASTVAALSRGEALPRIAQDSRLATVDPLPRPGTWSIDLAHWPATRVWHFLKGLSPLHDDLIVVAGRTVSCQPDVRLLDEHQNGVAGTIVVTNGVFRLFCADGIVEGNVVPPLTRLRRRISRWLHSR